MYVQQCICSYLPGWLQPVIQSLRCGFFVLVVVSVWCLLGIIFFDYLLGNILGLFSTSIYSQAWVILLLAALSFSSALKAAQLKIKQWFSTTKMGVYIAEPLGKYQAIAARGLHYLYTNLYLLADVVFCIGAPLLIVAASAGWWLLDEVSYLALLGYCCMISVIVFSGLYSNLVRLLSLGYFFGYWLVSDDLLLYPFFAPALVQKNITIMISGSAASWLPIIGLGLIVYLWARRRASRGLERQVSSSEQNSSISVVPKFLEAIPKASSRELFGSGLSLFCLVMAVPLAVLVLNNIIAYLNPHVLFAGFAIWILDRHWQTDVASEPALSSDFRYFTNLILKH